MYKNYKEICRQVHARHLRETYFLANGSGVRWRTYIMRASVLTSFLTSTLVSFGAVSYGQNVSIKGKSVTLRNVFIEINKQTGYTYIWDAKSINPSNTIDANIKDRPLKEALNELLYRSGLTFEIDNKTIVIKESPKSTLSGKVRTDRSQQQPIVLKVTDADGHIVQGATLRLKSMIKQVFISGKDGCITVPAELINQPATLSYIGMVSKDVTLRAPGTIQVVQLTTVENKVEEVIVTGMMNIDKKTFSGASSTFTKEDLLMVSNSDVVTALKSLDPSFLVMENNLSGSNPNTLPTIELRGATSITSETLRDDFLDDPNQPLFVLDGFQTTLRAILDLDMNRIESITVLKDAASTAIYGSRASNGVVVVETVKPKEGELRLSYSNDMNLSLADLRSYNMMNAAEKLEFERLSGVYTAPIGQPETQYSYYTPLYSSRLEKVLSGINTYWLNEPIHTGFTHKQALYAEGGSKSFLYNVGGSYKNANGVMKGSGREDWSGRINLTYRTEKLRINNNLTIQGFNSTESNYGSFSTWVNTIPYYAPVDINNPIMEEYAQKESGDTKIKIYNPLYNTNLQSFDRSKNLGITNNFQLQYDFNKKLRLQGGLQIAKNTTTTETFISPLNTQFEEVSTLLKGKYTSYNTDSYSYTANTMLTYANRFAEKHIVNGSARMEFSENNNSGLGFTAVGFPISSNGNPAFAYGYETGGSPRSSKRVNRRNSIISRVSYSYDNRYNADFSFNYDGSTSFGSQNVYSPFYSVGGSWNLHNESFLKNNSKINTLRIRANIGVTGNQNFPSTSSISTYQYLSLYDYIGQGVGLSSYKNDNLQWQKTTQFSPGIDGIFFGNRLTVDLNAYRKVTNNVIVAVDLPASTGLKAYPMNAGDLIVKGLELTARYNFIYRPKDKFIWNVGVTGSTNSQKYDNFNNLLELQNQSLQESSSLQHYKDGYSPNDLWAVRSLGIDPATGKELFLKLDGSQTFSYDATDKVVVGNKNPTLQGVISTNLTYKNFTFSAYGRYIYDQDVFNSALFDKVENISKTSAIQNNQDKRALYERWKEPGDISEFRAISLTSSTSMSSRFIQRENSFSFESISLSYDFKDSKWIKHMGLQNLRVTGYTNDVFKWSTIRRERGIDYPYAKTFSFTLRGNF